MNIFYQITLQKEAKILPFSAIMPISTPSSELYKFISEARENDGTLAIHIIKSLNDDKIIEGIKIVFGDTIPKYPEFENLIDSLKNCSVF